jgi:hypothetical protein
LAAHGEGEIEHFAQSVGTNDTGLLKERVRGHIIGR